MMYDAERMESQRDTVTAAHASVAPSDVRLTS